jgi:hypothetical protein
MTTTVKSSAPNPPAQGAMPILGEEGIQVWANQRIKALLNSVTSLIACAVSNSKAAPKSPQDGQLLLSRNPWRPVAGQTTDQWVYYDAAAGIWRLLATAPTNT